jgi:hypothetical protein
MEREEERAELPLASETPIELQIASQEPLNRGNWSWDDVNNVTNELDSCGYNSGHGGRHLPLRFQFLITWLQV